MLGIVVLRIWKKPPYDGILAGNGRLKAWSTRVTIETGIDLRIEE